MSTARGLFFFKKKTESFIIILNNYVCNVRFVILRFVSFARVKYLKIREIVEIIFPHWLPVELARVASRRRWVVNRPYSNANDE